MPSLQRARGGGDGRASSIAIAGAHGIGRIDLIEDRVVGLKSREVYECPAAIVLIAAHRALERLVLTRDELRFKALADRRYAELIYDGLVDAAAARRARCVQRSAARADDRRGALAAASRELRPSPALRSPFALYRERLATYGRGDAFDHQAASGFIALQALPLEAFARERARSVAAESRR